MAGAIDTNYFSDKARKDLLHLLQSVRLSTKYHCDAGVVAKRPVLGTRQEESRARTLSGRLDRASGQYIDAPRTWRRSYFLPRERQCGLFAAECLVSGAE